MRFLVSWLSSQRLPARRQRLWRFLTSHRSATAWSVHRQFSPSPYLTSTTRRAIWCATSSSWSCVTSHWLTQWFRSALAQWPDVQAGFRKGRGIRDQIVNIRWIIDKAREFQKKTSNSALLTMPKSLTVWITINCGAFWKRWEYQTTWPASWETYMQVRSNS